MLKHQANRKIDSWAIRLYASMFLNDGLCLHPRKSLVNNIGHDDSGVHCGCTDAYDVGVSKDHDFIFTTNIRENEQAVLLIA